MSLPTDESPSVTTTAEEPPDPKRWAALAIVLLAAFMDLLDVTIVNVAVPSIQTDLHAGYSAIEWVTAGYALSFAALLITGGRLGDIFGRKKLLMLGMAGFTVASLLCGVAVSPGMLISARILQGAMAALMVPQVLAVIHVAFPASERGKVFGMYGSIGGLAVLSGPILGGVFVNANLFGWDWRPIFLVNIPVGVLGCIAAAYYVTESKSPKAPRLDLVGVALATIAVLLLVYPLTEGRDRGWPAWIFVMMAASLVMVAVFVLYERRLTAQGRTPLIVLSLFKARSFAGGFSVNLLFNLSYGTFFLMSALYMQIGLGWSALHAGLTGVPFFLGLAVSAGMAVQFLTPKYGRKVMFAGGILLVAGTVIYIVLVNRYMGAIHSWEMSPALFVMGLGMGLVVAPLVDFALTDVPHDAAGSASGVLSTTQQLGNSIGIALVAALFLAPLAGQAAAGVDSVAPKIRHELSAAGLRQPAQDAVISGFKICAKDQAGEKDPAVVPASCKKGPPAGVTAQQATAVAKVMRDNSPAVTADTFSRSFRNGMGWVAGLLVLVTLLMVTMPKFARPQEV